MLQPDHVARFVGNRFANVAFEVGAGAALGDGVAGKHETGFLAAIIKPCQ